MMSYFAHICAEPVFMGEMILKRYLYNVGLVADSLRDVGLVAYDPMSLCEVNELLHCVSSLSFTV